MEDLTEVSVFISLQIKKYAISSLVKASKLVMSMMLSFYAVFSHEMHGVPYMRSVTKFSQFLRVFHPTLRPYIVVVVVALLIYVHGKHLRSCRDGQLT